MRDQRLSTKEIGLEIGRVIVLFIVIGELLIPLMRGLPIMLNLLNFLQELLRSLQKQLFTSYKIRLVIVSPSIMAQSLLSMKILLKTLVVPSTLPIRIVLGKEEPMRILTVNSELIYLKEVVLKTLPRTS